MQNKDWNQQEDPIFDKFNELTVGKINQIEGARIAGYSTPDGLKKRGEALKGKGKGKIISEYQKKRLSEANKGKVVSEEVKQKISESHKGKQFTEDHKKNIGETSKGRVKDESWKNMISELHKGKPKSEEHRRKMSESISKAKIKPYAIYKEITYSRKELNSILGFPLDGKQLCKVKAGKKKDEWGIIFL